MTDARWIRRSLRRLAVALASQCVRAHRCVATAGSARGTCVASERLELTTVRAWYAPVDASLQVRVNGVTPGTDVTQARLELLASDGASLLSVPARAVYVRSRDLSSAWFEGTVDLSYTNLDAAVLARAATIRVSVIDNRSTESAPREAPIARATEVASGARCDDPSTVCSAGLTCTQRRTDSVCEPVVASGPCSVSGLRPVWAPPAAGVYTIEGMPPAFGGATSCLSTRVGSQDAALFVAPRSGHYVFEGQGLNVVEVTRDCAMPACVRNDLGPRVEIDLAAGDRVPLTVLASQSMTRGSVRVTVP